MAKVTTVRNRVVQTPWRISRLYMSDAGHSVAIDRRLLSTLAECKRTTSYYASRGAWWLVGKLYGELVNGKLPDLLVDESTEEAS